MIWLLVIISIVLLIFGPTIIQRVKIYVRNKKLKEKQKEDKIREEIKRKGRITLLQDERK